MTKPAVLVRWADGWVAAGYTTDAERTERVVNAPHLTTEAAALQLAEHEVSKDLQDRQITGETVYTPGSVSGPYAGWRPGDTVVAGSEGEARIAGVTVQQGDDGRARVVPEFESATELWDVRQDRAMRSMFPGLLEADPGASSTVRAESPVVFDGPIPTQEITWGVGEIDLGQTLVASPAFKVDVPSRVVRFDATITSPSTTGSGFYVGFQVSPAATFGTEYAVTYELPAVVWYQLWLRPGQYHATKMLYGVLLAGWEQVTFAFYSSAADPADAGSHLALSLTIVEDGRR